MFENDNIEFLNGGDVSVQFQVAKYITNQSMKKLLELQNRIPLEGFGKKLLDLRDETTHMWGKGIYSPKWISTHYTLLELNNIGCDMTLSKIHESTKLILDSMWVNSGMVRKGRYQDTCVVAMMLQLCSVSETKSEKINEIVDHLLAHQFDDGGWNCEWQRGAIHSSLHTTISVLEAFRDYEEYGHTYRLPEVKLAVPKGIEFMLKKHLFRSVRTNEIIDHKMLMMSFPTRWGYDILRALVYLSSVSFPYDDRMEEAIDYLLNKQTSNHLWNMQTARKNLVHFEQEKNGSISRWNTLRVLRVLKSYRPELYLKYIQ